MGRTSRLRTHTCIGCPATSTRTSTRRGPSNCVGRLQTGAPVRMRHRRGQRRTRTSHRRTNRRRSNCTGSPSSQSAPSTRLPYTPSCTHTCRLCTARDPSTKQGIQRGVHVRSRGRQSQCRRRISHDGTSRAHRSCAGMQGWREHRLHPSTLGRTGSGQDCRGSGHVRSRKADRRRNSVGGEQSQEPTPYE